MMACVTGWFDTHRSLAVSLVSAGIGMAPMTMSPLVAWLVSSYDWRTTMQLLAAVVAAIMIPVALLIRRPPALAGGIAASGDAGPQSEMSLSQAIRSPQFIILLATNFFCCATHSGPIIHTVSYAISCGIPMLAAVSIYSVEGLAGLGGRIVFGLLGDRLGARRVLVVGLLIQAFGALVEGARADAHDAGDEDGGGGEVAGPGPGGAPPGREHGEGEGAGRGTHGAGRGAETGPG
eukprot:gene30960-41211_t